MFTVKYLTGLCQGLGRTGIGDWGLGLQARAETWGWGLGLQARAPFRTIRCGAPSCRTSVRGNKKGRVSCPAFQIHIGGGVAYRLIGQPAKLSGGAPVPGIEAGATPWLQSDGCAR